MSVFLPQFPGGGRYRRLGPTLKKRFGERVIKITLRAGFSCPNRDGRVGSGGCIFCSENALLPKSGPIYGSIEEQLAAGFVANQKTRITNLAIAYFQDQTATDAPIEILSNLYTQAINHPKILALSVGTRPDWISQDVFELLAKLSKIKPVLLELGLQSANDEILKKINRGHKVADFEQAVIKAHEMNLEVVAHVILGLPGETPSDRIATASCLNKLEVDGVKIHNLHVLAGTPLAKWFQEGTVQIASIEEYANMVAGFLQHLNPDMIIHRLTGQGPQHLMLAPKWALEKRKAVQHIEKTLKSKDVWQGKLFTK